MYIDPTGWSVGIWWTQYQAKQNMYTCINMIICELLKAGLSVLSILMQMPNSVPTFVGETSSPVRLRGATVTYAEQSLWRLMILVMRLCSYYQYSACCMKAVLPSWPIVSPISLLIEALNWSFNFSNVSAFHLFPSCLLCLRCVMDSWILCCLQRQQWVIL